MKRNRFDAWMDAPAFPWMQRSPKRIWLLAVTLAFAYWGSCVALGVAESL